jgi:hypothetical protein
MSTDLVRRDDGDAERALRQLRAEEEMHVLVLARLEREARFIAKMPGLQAQLAGQPDRVVAVALVARDLGLPANFWTISSCFDWIEGRVSPRAQVLIGMAAARGHRVEVPVANDRYATAVVQRRGSKRANQVTVTMEDAERAGRRDLWYENWTGPEGHRRKEVWRVGSEEPRPEWAKGEPKRYEAWWLHPDDMLAKTAARKAIKRYLPEVHIGLPEVFAADDFDVEGDDVDETPDQEGDFAAGGEPWSGPDTPPSPEQGEEEVAASEPGWDDPEKAFDVAETEAGDHPGRPDEEAPAGCPDPPESAGRPSSAPAVPLAWADGLRERALAHGLGELEVEAVVGFATTGRTHDLYGVHQGEEAEEVARVYSGVLAKRYVLKRTAGRGFIVRPVADAGAL